MTSRFRAVLPLFLLLLPLGPAHAALAPAHYFSKGFGSSAINEMGRSVVTDAAGHVYMVGQFTNTVNFGGGHSLTSAGNYDGFLAIFDQNGNTLDASRIGGPGNDVANGIAYDPAGYILVTGSFSGLCDFGSGVTATSAGGTDIFVVQYYAGTLPNWVKSYGNASDDAGTQVAVDAGGNVLVTGQFAGSVNFGGGLLNSAGNTHDIFLLKLNSVGTYVAASRFGSSTGYESGYDVAVDASGNVFLTGYIENTVSFGGSNLVSAGGDDAFIAKFNSALVHQWSQRFGSSGPDYGYSLAVASTGDVYVCGGFSGTVNFGGSPLVSAGNMDIFFAKYTNGGVHVWSKRFGSANLDVAYALALDAKGQPSIAGDFTGGGLNFGDVSLPYAGGDEIFVAKFTSAGNTLWSGAFGNQYTDIAFGIANDPAGNVYITGNFTWIVNFGGGALTSNNTSDDIFLAKYSGFAAQPLIKSIADIGADQGHKVKIRFDPSGFDAAWQTPITQYEAYRRDDPAPALSAPMPAGASREQLLRAGWTQVGFVTAHGENSYGMDVPTIGDSTLTLGQYLSVFYIRAATAASTTFFDSPPDSGYSKDNLAPSVPANFVYASGNLTWHSPVDEDFKFFSLYGSNANSFATATLVNYTTGTNMNVAATPYLYYYVTATDFSGNEGKPAKVYTLSGVGGTPKSYVLSLSNYPNPFNPRTTVKYTVPVRGMVDINVYDASGGHVATLFHGERNAGAYSVDWDGRAIDGATFSSGVYFARITQNGMTRTKKMVLLK